jgi:hypothetical protein
MERALFDQVLTEMERRLDDPQACDWCCRSLVAFHCFLCSGDYCCDCCDLAEHDCAGVA